MLAIYKRELRSYFNSFIGFLFIAVTLFFVSLYFYIYNLFNGYPYVSYALSGVVFLFLITVPVLCMRVLAEERRNRTDQLILTAPVSVYGIVIGKFLALVTILVIPTLVVCTYPLIMSIYGTVPMAESYLSILGFFLYGMASIAVGVFVSSLTESQVIAAVLSFIALFLGYMMNGLCSLISSTENIVTRVLRLFDMSTPFDNMLTGTLNIQSIFYYILLTILVLFLTVQSIQKRRYSASVKNISMGAYSIGGIVLVASVIAVVNLIIDALPVSMTSIDVTDSKLYSLTEQTEEFLKTLEEDVVVYVLSSKNDQDDILGQTLDRYEEASDHIKVEYVDPNVNPGFFKKYTDSTTFNSLIVVGDKRFKVIDYSEIYESDYAYDYTTGGYSSTTTGYDGEGQLTSAIDYVVSDNMPKIYMTTGHGENVFSDTFQNIFKKQNVESEVLNLMNYEKVPEDAEALIIYSAVSDFSDEDKDKVISYLDEGGKVIYIAGYAPDVDMPNLDAVLEHMGLSVAEGLVAEQDTSCYYRNPFCILPNINYSTYTNGIYDRYYVFAPYVQGIVVNDRDGLVFDRFLTTSATSYSKTGDINTENYKKTETDVDGPFAVGVSSKLELENGKDALLVAFGCSQIFTDEADRMVSGANQILFGNTISSLVEQEVNVSVPIKSYEVSNLAVSERDALFWAVLLILVLPAGLTIIGFAVWFRRRRR